MDLEGLSNVLLGKGISKEDIISRLVEEILTFKELSKNDAESLARAVLEDVTLAKKRTEDPLLRTVLDSSRSGASMHDLGVGCRGEGDFFVHRLIAEIAGKNSLIPPEEQDDAGAVEAAGKYVVSAIDGTHSRLSDFPFLAGFHVARAAIRDVLVKGATPLALIDDLHLSDDGDVGKLFDFVAGVAAVGELSGTPIIAGSTLRTGGDMVIGNRMVSGVGCIAVADKLLKRSDVKVGDRILMTNGAGGGTIATTAIYSGKNDVAKETLNVDFIKAVEVLRKDGHLEKIHAMLDVTNGGLRGDANEVCKTARVGIELDEENIRSLVNPKVAKLLKEEGIDYLGVSLDSLLLFCADEDAKGILSSLNKKDIKAAEVGKVVGGDCARLDGRDFSPKFRESAYTKVKKTVGEDSPADGEGFKEDARLAADNAKKKLKEVVRHVKETGFEE